MSVSACVQGGRVDSLTKQTLFCWVPPAPAEQSMDVDSAPAPKQTPPEPVPESEVYFRLLILHYLLASQNTYKQAIDFAHKTIERIQSLNRRSMDPLAAKVWYAVERAYELTGQLADARP